MSKKKIRVSIDLTADTVRILRKAGSEDGRLLKNYLENKLEAVAKRKKANARIQ